MSGPASGLEIAMEPYERLLYASRIAAKASHDVGGCLVWHAAVVVSGAGERRPVMRMHGRQVKAYRVVAACVAGRLDAGMVVSHLCDNPMCVRPSHLKVSTQGWNMADMDTKGRRGRTAFGGKMSKADVEKLYGMIDGGMSQRQAAAAMGVSQPAVCRWVRTRKHTPACARDK